MFGLGRFFRRKKEDDYDDLRTHVLGEKFRDDDFTPRTREVFERQQDEIRPDPEFAVPEAGRDFEPAPPRDFAPPQFQPQSQEQRAEKVNRDYDILQRLEMIENQLAVVRSQTETINERLKNMDARFQRQRF